jgi:hypothetical protein
LLAGTAVLGLTAFGSVPASAVTAATPGPWESYNDTTVFPAGTACKDKVSVHSVGRVRTTTLQKDRHYFVEYDNRSRSTWTNTKNKKSWSRTDGGDVDRRISRDGDTIQLPMTGDNWGQGKGIRGIIWSHGVVDVTQTNARSTANATYHVTLGRNTQRVQVCTRIGSSAVPGKNVP